MKRESLQLATEMGWWTIELVGGGSIQLRAHAFTKVGSEHVFSILMEGEPCFEIDILSIASSLVASVRGG
ncbi:MAG: hypothetical protein ACRDIU_06625 [Actinomycetota bacterium]